MSLHDSIFYRPNIELVGLPLSTEGIYHLSPMVPPPSSLAASFDWGRFAGYRLPSYVPFEITVQASHLVVPNTIIDEGSSISILSSNTWKAFGPPPLVPLT